MVIVGIGLLATVIWAEDEQLFTSTVLTVYGPNPPIVPPGQPVQLQASGADTYSWTPPESLDNPAIANPKATPAITTTYTVVGTLAAGCPAQQTITVQISGDLSLLKVPNVFSPNGDGINDFWVIQGIEVFPDCTLTIFDENGRKLLEQKGYNNNWNGTYNGHEVPPATYYYVLGCPDKKPIMGNVLIAR